MPRAIFAERPYLAVPKPVFWGPILGRFFAYFTAFPSPFTPYNHTRIKLIINNTDTVFMPALNYTSNSQLIQT